MKKKGLGRGLDVLLNHYPKAGNAEQINNEKIQLIPIEKLVRSLYQPRIIFAEDALAALALSIKEQGIIQPLVVRQQQDQGVYEILAGERRWRAAQLAGLHDVPAIIRQVSDQSALAIALIENIQREDLNVIEEANAIARLIAEFSLTHEEAGQLLGKSRTNISNTLRLLDLNEKVQLLIMEKQIDMGHARALLSLSKPLQYDLAYKIIAQGLTVRATEDLVRKLQRNESGIHSKFTKKIDPDIVRLQENISEQLSAKVLLKHQSSGKGRLIIEYHSLDQLDDLVHKFKN